MLIQTLLIKKKVGRKNKVKYLLESETKRHIIHLLMYFLYSYFQCSIAIIFPHFSYMVLGIPI